VVSKLALGQFVFRSVNPGTSPGNQILHKPRLPIETKKTCNASWSRVHQISARDDFAGPVSCHKRAEGQTTGKAPENQSVA